VTRTDRQARSRARMAIIGGVAVFPKSRRIEVGAAALAAGLGLAYDAAAQPPIPSAGQGAFDRHVTVSLQASATYDDGLSTTAASEGSPSSLRRSDVIYAPNAAVDISLPFGRVWTFAAGDIGYDFYQSDSDFNSSRIGLTAGASTTVGVCGASVTGNIARGQRGAEDLTRRVTRNISDSRSIALQAQCAPIAGFTTSAGVSYTNIRNSADAGVVDSEGTSFNGSIGYQNRALGSVQVVGQYARQDSRPKSPTPGIPTAPGTEIYNVALQYGRPIGRKLDGHVGAGYGNVVTRTAGVGDDSFLFADVGLNYRATSRLSADLSARRNASSTYLEGIDYILNTQVRAGLSYAVSPRLGTTLGLGWSKRRYKGQIDPAVIGALSEDEVFTVSAGLSYAVGDRSNVSLSASYQDRQANEVALSFESFRASIVASTSF
jgi:hypothetical protein